MIPAAHVQSSTKQFTPIVVWGTAGTDVPLPPTVYQRPAPAFSLVAVRAENGPAGREADVAHCLPTRAKRAAPHQDDGFARPQRVVRRQMPPAATGSDYCKAMMKAVADKDIKTLKAFIRSADAVDCLDDAGLSPLIGAIANGSSQAIKLLLKKGANPNLVYPSGATPLIYAVYAKKVVAVKILLEAKADPLAVTPSGMSALDVARHYGCTKIIHVLGGDACSAARPEKGASSTSL